jgi:hypothetical protein
MATKNFCDICGSEFKGGELYGGLMRQKKVYPVSNVVNANNTSQIIPEGLDMCFDCQTKVWAFAEGIIKSEKAKKDAVQEKR